MKRLALLVLLIVVTPALPSRAHPLGNFTTNVHLGIEITSGELSADVVVDMAEIPTFREPLDLDGDASISPHELEAYAFEACTEYPDSIRLVADTGAEFSLQRNTSLARLLPGSGGLLTLRVECAYSTVVPAGVESIAVANDVHGDRSGWAEIVVTGAMADGAETISPSQTLTSYPDGAPLSQRETSIELGTVPVPATSETVPEPGLLTSSLGTVTAGGGILAIVAALGLGITHALAPGHGKTLMAAYLVGRRGTAVHAAGLGLATAVSHTIGVAVLGILTATASSQFRPEAVYPWLTTISATTVTAVGVVLLIRAAKGHTHHHHDGDDGHHHDEHHQHAATADHSGRRIVGWRSLAALGLAGGLVPSASAVVLLLGAVAIGRPWFGLLLVAAFGFGMSIALVTVGIAALKFSQTGLRRLRRRLVIRPQLVSALAGTAVMTLGVFLLWDASRALIG